MVSVKVWFLETRPHFLLLTPMAVFVGIAVAIAETSRVNPAFLALAFVGGLLAHISVNVLNDYFDYRSGIDLVTRRTPFSGGSGFLPAGTLSPRSVCLFGIISLAALIPLGIYVMYAQGLGILPVGIVGMLIILLYTTYLTRNSILCAIAPGLGFGPLMVLGAYFVQTGSYSIPAVVAALVPGFLVSNLLLLNEFPDVEADRVGARHHLPIAIGRRKSAWVYAGLIAATYIWLIAFVAAGVLPILALLGLLTLPLGMRAVQGVLKHFDNMEGLKPFLAINIQVVLLTPILMGIGILVSGFPS